MTSFDRFVVVTAAALTLAAASFRAGASGSVQDAAPPRVRVVLFTHIEDNTPAGALGTAANRAAYLSLRARIIEMARLAQLHQTRWTLQPDWKILLAAQQYETPDVTASSEGLNVFRYIRDVLGARIDPHSHEGSGYNYTDVAHLLETLGVSGSTVIGGHIWDPSLPQFQEWDRFRSPVRGQRYPQAVWRGDTLMGSGTPNHTNDPIVSGIWRPAHRNAYFADDPSANIAAVGGFRGDLPGVLELVDLYRTGAVDPGCLLTSTQGIRPIDLMAPGGIATIEATVVRPFADLRDRGEIVLTDFTSLIREWREEFGGRACLIDLTPR